MGPQIQSSAPLRSRIPLSLPSSRSPSMKVKKNPLIHLYELTLIYYQYFLVCWIFQQLTLLLSCSISPRTLLGAVHWLWGSLSGLWLHRVRSIPHGAVLDPEQGAHPVQWDRGGAARYPVFCWSQCGQDGPHQPGWDLLQCHETINSEPTHRQPTGLAGFLTLQFCSLRMFLTAPRHKHVMKVSTIKLEKDCMLCPCVFISECFSTDYKGKKFAIAHIFCTYNELFPSLQK